MKWQEEAIEDLKKYPQLKESLDNIKERISALKSAYTALKSISMDTTPIMSRASNNEDRLINNIVERERLECSYKATKKLVDLIEKGLNNLNDRERLVLEGFYVYRNDRHVEILMDKLNYEQRRIYQIKDEALYKFTISMYGIIDY